MADKVGITYLSVPVKAGIVEGIASANIDLTVTVMDFIDGVTNTAPTFSDESPTGATEESNAEISWSSADDVQVNNATLTVTLTDPDDEVIAAITNNVDQEGFTSSSTANASHGYATTLTGPLMKAGLWTANVSVYDGDAAPLEGTTEFSWTVVAEVPTISLESPTGSAVGANVPVTFRVTVDPTLGVVDTLQTDVTLTLSGEAPIAAVVNGVAATGYSVSFTAVTGGYDVSVAHPAFAEGDWTVGLAVGTVQGGEATSSYGFTRALTPEISANTPTATARVTSTSQAVGFTATDEGDNLSDTGLALAVRTPLDVLENAVVAGVEAAGWTATITETSPGVFRVVATRDAGLFPGLWRPAASAVDDGGLVDSLQWEFSFTEAPVGIESAGKLSRSERMILGPRRAVTAVETSAPSGDAGWDVEEYDQVALIVQGNVVGRGDIQVWRRYRIPVASATQMADTWLQGERVRDVGLLNASGLYRGHSVFLVNTVGCDRLQVLVPAFYGSTAVYVNALGMTKAGAVMLPGALKPSLGPGEIIRSGANLWHDAGAKKALTDAYVIGSWIELDGATEALILCKLTDATATSVEVKPSWSPDGGTTKVAFDSVDLISSGVVTTSDFVWTKSGSGVPLTFMLRCAVPLGGHFTIYAKHTAGSAPNLLATLYLQKVS